MKWCLHFFWRKRAILAQVLSFSGRITMGAGDSKGAGPQTSYDADDDDDIFPQPLGAEGADGAGAGGAGPGGKTRGVTALGGKKTERYL